VLAKSKIHTASPEKRYPCRNLECGWKIARDQAREDGELTGIMDYFFEMPAGVNVENDPVRRITDV
jgi:hypothetical protein